MHLCLHVHVIVLQNIIFQQSGECDSPTHLGFHIKLLGILNPTLREAKPHQGAQAAQHFTRSG